MKTEPLILAGRKRRRAVLVRDYMAEVGLDQAVVFTCGNAAAALRASGVANVLEIGKQGELAPTRWWQPHEIALWWPQAFDATSGHLPLPMLADLALDYHAFLALSDTGLAYLVPTGSGETVLALRMAFPEHTFVACWGWPGLADATTYDKGQGPTVQLAMAGPWLRLEGNPAPEYYGLEE